MTVLDPADHGAGTLVSGTKVELNFLANVKENGTSPTPPQRAWNWAEIKKLDVTCADASPALDVQTYFSRVVAPPGLLRGTAGDLSGPVEDYPTLVTGSVPVRIASTEFADGSTIHFLIHCKVELSARDDMNNVLESKIVDRMIVATLTVCNRVLLLATNEEYATVYNDLNHTQPLYQAYLTTLGPYTSPTQPLYKKAAADAMPLVRPFWDAVHHTIFPDAGKEAKWGENAANTDTVWRTQNLNAEMSKTTAFFAFTHGENTNPVHFRASVGPNTVSDGQVYGTEVRSYADAGRAIPNYQVAIFYACSLGSATSLPSGFRMDTNNQPWRVIAGFPRVVFYQLYGSTTTLDQHAKKLMEFLSQGYPFAWALQKVQGPTSAGGLNMVPKDSANGSMPMIAPGPYLSDSYPQGNYTRLRYVYLDPDKYNATTTSASQRNSWFYLYDF